MTELEIQTTHIQVPNGDLQIDSYLAQASGESPFFNSPYSRRY